MKCTPRNGSRFRVSHPERDEDVGVLPWQHEAGRHHANHGVIVSAEGNCFADGMRVAAQKVLPERIAHHDNSRSAFYVFLRRDDPAEHRGNSKRFEKSRVNEPRANLHRFQTAGVVHVLDIDSATLGKCARLPLDID